MPSEEIPTAKANPAAGEILNSTLLLKTPQLRFSLPGLAEQRHITSSRFSCTSWVYFYRRSELSMACADCFTGHVHLGTPTGEATTLHGIRTYVAAP